MHTDASSFDNSHHVGRTKEAPQFQQQNARVDDTNNDEVATPDREASLSRCYAVDQRRPAFEQIQTIRSAAGSAAARVAR